MDLKTEKFLFQKGCQKIAAIDEVGRGPLAGPVVVAALVLDKNFEITEKLKDVKDSKKLSEKKREKLFPEIQNSFLDIGIGLCDQVTIDRINILEATFLAMKKAISSLKEKVDFVILDGKMTIPNFTTPQKAFVKGDNLVFSIAAASIVAKVTRDKMMKKFALQYPQYGFLQNKGYGTKAHFEAIKKFGITDLHRKSFLKKIK